MAEVGTMTVPTHMHYAPSMSEYRTTWTASAGGIVSGINKTFGTGYLVAVRIIPNLGGTQPTNLFDVTLLDSDGLDLLGGYGADCANTGPTQILLDPPVPVNGTSLQVTVNNAGASTTGEVVIIVGAEGD